MPNLNVQRDIAVSDDEPLSVTSLVGKYHSVLLSLLRRRMRGSDEAADIAQEAYVRMLQYEGSRNIQSPFSMLVRIAFNVANDRGRADRVRCVAAQCPIDNLEIVSDHPTPETEVAATQDLQQVFTAIEDLPVRCRQVFLLSRVENLTYTQIAAHCGISVKMVEKHISNALAFCRILHEPSIGNRCLS